MTDVQLPKSEGEQETGPGLDALRPVVSYVQEVVQRGFECWEQAKGQMSTGAPRVDELGKSPLPEVTVGQKSTTLPSVGSTVDSGADPEARAGRPASPAPLAPQREKDGKETTVGGSPAGALSETAGIAGVIAGLAKQAATPVTDGQPGPDTKGDGQLPPAKPRAGAAPEGELPPAQPGTGTGTDGQLPPAKPRAGAAPEVELPPAQPATGTGTDRQLPPAKPRAGAAPEGELPPAQPGTGTAPEGQLPPAKPAAMEQTNPKQLQQPAQSGETCGSSAPPPARPGDNSGSGAPAPAWAAPLLAMSGLIPALPQVAKELAKVPGVPEGTGNTGGSPGGNNGGSPAGGNNGESCPAPGKEKALPSTTSLLDTINTFLTGGSAIGDTNRRLPVPQASPSQTVQPESNFVPAATPQRPETKALPVLTGSVGDLVGTTISVMTNSVAQVANLVQQSEGGRQATSGGILPMVAGKAAPEVTSPTFPHGGSAGGAGNQENGGKLLSDFGNRIGSAIGDFLPKVVTDYGNKVVTSPIVVDNATPPGGQRLPEQIQRLPEMVRLPEVLQRVVETPLAKAEVIPANLSTINSADNVARLDNKVRLDDAGRAENVVRVGDALNSSRVDNVTRVDSSLRTDTSLRADNAVRVDNAARVDNGSRVDSLARIDHAGRIDNMSRIDDRFRQDNSGRSSDPSPKETANVARELTALGSREPISLTLAKSDLASNGQLREVTRVDGPTSRPDSVSLVSKIDGVSLVSATKVEVTTAGALTDLSSRNDAVVREGTMRGIAAVADANGRVIGENVSIRLLGDKRGDLIAMGEGSVKISTGQPVTITNGIIIIPEKKGVKREGDDAERSDGDTDGNIDPTAGMRVNPILVNGSNAPTSSNSSQDQDPNATAGNGMPTNVDPDSINASLPTVQVVDPDEEPTRENNSEKDVREADRRLRLEEEQRRQLEEAKVARERAERIRREFEEKQRRIQEALLAELATKKTQTMIENEIRRKYIVKEGDTLESIAELQLNDIHLALLVYRVNKLTIKHNVENGKHIPELRPGMVLYLPNMTDIVLFRENVNAGSSLQASHSAKDQAWDRLFGKPGEQPIGARLRYTVKLGDSLALLAARHPALHDVSLWKLIARINNLSMDTDSGGKPLAILRRGSVLLLPTVQEISEFRAEPANEAESHMIAC